MLVWIIAGALLVPLIAYGYVGSFTRYISDDYCTAAFLHSKGFLRANGFLFLHLYPSGEYHNWGGRFASTFAVFVAELIGPRLVSFLPSLALALWFLGIAWASAQWCAVLRLHYSLVASLAFAGLILNATVANTPNVEQSLYWQTAMLTYTAPLILLTFCVGFLGNFVRHRPHIQPNLLLLLSVSLAFFLGGFSEVATALQVVALGLTACALSMRVANVSRRSAQDNSLFSLVLGGLAGSIIALVVIWLAPGTQARLGTLHHVPSGLLLIGVISLYHAALIMAHALRFGWSNWLITLIISVFLGLRSNFFMGSDGPTQEEEIRNRGRALVLLPAIAFILIVSCFAPASYARALPDRLVIVPIFVLACLFVLWGFLIGHVLGVMGRQGIALPHLPWLPFKSPGASGMFGATRWKAVYAQFVYVIVVVLVVFGPIASAYRALALVPSERAYAEAWDKRDRQVRDGVRRGEKQLEVVALNRTGFLHEPDLIDDPGFRVNQCFAEYYGLKSVIAR